MIHGIDCDDVIDLKKVIRVSKNILLHEDEFERFRFTDDEYITIKVLIKHSKGAE